MTNQYGKNIQMTNRIHHLLESDNIATISLSMVLALTHLTSFNFDIYVKKLHIKLKSIHYTPTIAFTKHPMYRLMSIDPNYVNKEAIMYYLDVCKLKDEYKYIVKHTLTVKKIEGLNYHTLVRLHKYYNINQIYIWKRANPIIEKIFDEIDLVSFLSTNIKHYSENTYVNNKRIIPWEFHNKLFDQYLNAQIECPYVMLSLIKLLDDDRTKKYNIYNILNILKYSPIRRKHISLFKTILKAVFKLNIDNKNNISFQQVHKVKTLYPYYHPNLKRYPVKIKNIKYTKKYKIYEFPFPSYFTTPIKS